MQLQQVVINLAINARDAMPRGGTLTLGTEAVEVDDASRRLDLPLGAYARITVSDTGCGMDRETLTHIFEPFFTTKGADRGTGLGLSTVYGIVEQNGGAIAVESEPGHGTTVEIYLPLVEEPAESAHRDLLPDSESLRGSETILLVEDEEQVRRLISRVLSDSGYKVLEARNGEDALEVCRSNDVAIHLMVTDVVMPGMDGRELAERLAAMRPEMKVMYVSGHAEERLGQRKLEPLMRKPFTPDAILTQVHHLLATARRGSG